MEIHEISDHEHVAFTLELMGIIHLEVFIIIIYTTWECWEIKVSWGNSRARR